MLPETSRPHEPVAAPLRAAVPSLDLSRRAEPCDLPEWMDEPCSYQDFRACLRDLAQVNRLTLAYRPTLRFLDRVACGVAVGEPLHIVDVGCGGGDLLRRIERWAVRRKRPVRLTGIDLNPYAARAAEEFTSSSSRIQWITGDAFSLILANDAGAVQPVDVVLSSLFTHHLPTPEIVRFLAWMESVTSRGWFINDLCREPVPMRLFGLLARVARWHRFVQHDGPVSFRRSFREDDWQRMCTAAHVPAAPLLAARPASSLPALRIARWFPARLCVERYK